MGVLTYFSHGHGCHTSHRLIVDFIMGATLRIDYKHPSSLTRWLNLGLRKEREEICYRYRLDFLDRKI
jgi:hypothetical protein